MGSGTLVPTRPKSRVRVFTPNSDGGRFLHVVRRRFASAAEPEEVMLYWPQTTPASTTASALVKSA
jgi:hypothetical protein